MERDEELKLAWNNATSYPPGKQSGTYIGTIQKGSRTYDFYKEGSEYKYTSRNAEGGKNE